MTDKSCKVFKKLKKKTHFLKENFKEIFHINSWKNIFTGIKNNPHNSNNFSELFYLLKKYNSFIHSFNLKMYKQKFS